jgi:hypothetical protein
MAILMEVEEAWDPEFLAESDKSWDWMHRCFADGELDEKGGEYPLNHCVLGGIQLTDPDETDCIASLKTAGQVRDIAQALAGVDEAEMRRRFGLIDPNELEHGFEDDFNYMWGWFEVVRSLHSKAAKAGRAVVFNVYL